MLDISQFRLRLIEAIKQNKIILPTLPEVALRVRDAAEQENTTARQLADIIVTDPAISARLLQVANSPLYRPRKPIEDVQMAVARLGNKLVKSLVTSLAMKQIYQATTDFMEHKLHKVWEDSVHVAAVSKLLAQDHPELNNEQAMLAGLIHNIGTLPILTMAENFSDFSDSEQLLDDLADSLYAEIGSLILRSWDFPEEIAMVPLEHTDLQRQHNGPPDFADIVLVARIQLGLTKVAADDWSKIPAFACVGIEPDINITAIEENAEEIASVRQALN